MKITVNKGLCTECNYSDEEDPFDQVRNLSKLAAVLHATKKTYKGDYSKLYKDCGEAHGLGNCQAHETESPKDLCACGNERKWCIDCNTKVVDQRDVTANQKSNKTKPKDLSFGKKPPLSLVPPTALVLMSKAMEDGAKKRSAYNWRESKVSVTQLLDKVLRHTYKFLDGQNIDEESGLPELAHAAADLAVLIDAIETASVVDDRPKKGKTAALIKKHSNE